MERLSGLDASFLYLETPAQPLHVCSIVELDTSTPRHLDTSTMPGGYTFDRLRDALELRVKAIPELRKKLADSQLNPDHPAWVEDTEFDIARHLHRVGAPAPGGRAELTEVVMALCAGALRRSLRERDVGIISCPELLADVWNLADGFSAASALNELRTVHPLPR